MDEEYGESTESGKEDKSISSDLIRGHINTIILRSLSDGDKYGYEIIAEIEDKSKNQYSLKQPSLYSALKRLESQGYITSYWGGTVGGGRRKYFSLTEEGQQIADINRAEWEYSRTIIDSLISDKDFDFNNPAPAAVNMRVLKDTTSRVPSRDDEEKNEGKVTDEESLKRIEELEAEKQAIENELRESKAREEALLSEKQEQERAAEEARISYEERLAQAQAAEEEAMTENERLHYEALLQEKDEELEEERRRFEQELEEQEALFREREQEIMHQNFLNLVNAPPQRQEKKEDFEHYTAPVADEEDHRKAQKEAEEEVKDYRTVVQEMYANSVRSDASTTIKNDARSLGGIDFQDIEARAREDGIKIITTGKIEKTKQEASASIVHRGKALFMSAILLFFIIIVEGAIVMGLRNTYGIPIAVPCVMWGIGLALLLATGLAFANHFGQNSLRRQTPALVNSVVLYVLAVIVTLIVALAVNIDFHDAKLLACFVVIPVIYLFGIVIFGITYYLQVKPKK